jgi:hypothetical protein
MTTEELLAFCALPDTEKARAYVESRRALFEKMQEVCDWDKGLCPLPDGVLVDTKMPRTGYAR